MGPARFTKGGEGEEMYKIVVTMTGEVGTKVVTRTGFSRDEKEAVYFSSKEEAEKQARYMAHGLPQGHLTDMPTSHSPFFADPPGLAQRLHEIAQKV
jgi:hypothetical protein